MGKCTLCGERRHLTTREMCLTCTRIMDMLYAMCLVLKHQFNRHVVITGVRVGRVRGKKVRT